MDFRLALFFSVCLLVFWGCEKVSPDIVNFELDFTWGTVPGENRKNPEIKLHGVPTGTTKLQVQLVDLDVSFADHGLEETINYTNDNVIPPGALSNYIGPSPPPGGHLYEFTVKALDKNGVVIGIGKKAKRCCP